ncbi:kinase-like domain-containing protein [Rhizophagus clarus]|uniref:Kinase-like domain-containing protein n=1 Tax=Rhizophagus clarus TaxID=94130 RepID=A0A8H3MI59_9GLOM|nr:kinase-like domain-containing protein [Rhizophagus clarus]
MVLRYIYGGRLSLEEYDTSDIIKILVASNQSNNNPEPSITMELGYMTISRQKNTSIVKDYNIVVDEMNDFIYKVANEVLDSRLAILKVNEYFSIHNISAQETYNWLLNNQISTNSIFLLGYFNFYGIITSTNNAKAFDLFINASENNHALAQFFVGCCYEYGYGTIKNEKLSFEYYEKAANKNYAKAQLNIGYNYRNGLGIGIKIDKQKAFELYRNASNLGNKEAQYFLALISAEQGYEKARNNLKRLQTNNL